MKKFLLLIVLVTSLQGFAQIPQSLLEQHTYQSAFVFDDYLGSIYKTLSFEKGSVIEEKSSVFEDELRYNIDGDIFEYNFADTMYQIKKNPQIYVRIDDEYFYYCEFQTDNFLPVHGYYVLVDMNEDYSIYKKYTIKIKHPDKNGGPDGTATPGNLRMETTYYLEEDKFIKELPTNKGTALASFEDKKDELKKYMKSQKLRLNKEEDLIRFVSKYNALKSDNIGKSRSLLVNHTERN